VAGLPPGDHPARPSRHRAKPPPEGPTRQLACRPAARADGQLAETSEPASRHSAVIKGWVATKEPVLDANTQRNNNKKKTTEQTTPQKQKPPPPPPPQSQKQKIQKQKDEWQGSAMDPRPANNSTIPIDTCGHRLARRPSFFCFFLQTRDMEAQRPTDRPADTRFETPARWSCACHRRRSSHRSHTPARLDDLSAVRTRPLGYDPRHQFSSFPPPPRARTQTRRQLKPHPAHHRTVHGQTITHHPRAVRRWDHADGGTTAKFSRIAYPPSCESCSRLRKDYTRLPSELHPPLTPTHHPPNYNFE